MSAALPPTQSSKGDGSREAASGSSWLPAAIVIATSIVLAIGAFYLLDPQSPAAQADQLRTTLATSQLDTSTKDRLTLEKDLLVFETDTRIKIWTTIVQLLAGALAAGGAISVWQNYRTQQENLRTAQQKLDVDRKVEITNRFTQAITQIGALAPNQAPNIEVRLGGIYALEQIARDSAEKYHWTVMEVLTTYIRQNSQWHDGKPQTVDAYGKPRPRADVQAILQVLGRRSLSYGVGEPVRLFIGDADLRGLLLPDAQLRGAFLEGAHLEMASLPGTDLDTAILKDAHLGWANLEGARFAKTDLTGANLEKARVSDADFRESIGLTPDQLLAAEDSGNGALLPAVWTAQEAAAVRASWTGAHVQSDQPSAT
jgi:Pentapeptide repeats (8 copies)